MFSVQGLNPNPRGAVTPFGQDISRSSEAETRHLLIPEPQEVRREKISLDCPHSGFSCRFKFGCQFVFIF